MSFVKTSKRSYFVYHKDIEYLFATCGILWDNQINENLNIVYPKEVISGFRKNHPLLFEVFKDFGEQAFCFLEYVKNQDMSQFEASKMFEDLKAMGAEGFLQFFFEEENRDFSKEMTDKSACYAFYQKYQSNFPGFFGFCELVQNYRWVLEEFEKLYNEVHTKEAEQFLEKQEKEILSWKLKLEADLKGKDTKQSLLQYSQLLFGKTFYHVGPFEKFYFMPSLFMPCKIVRWYGEHQFLSFHCQLLTVMNTDVVLEQLKTLSDKSRHRILLLIKEKGTITGLEIAEKMGLSPSTVSHHMSGLRSSGLIHEENDGGVKYYSINQNAIKDCMKHLENSFL